MEWVMCIRHGVYGDQTYSQPSFQKSLIFKWQIDKEVKKNVVSLVYITEVYRVPGVGEILEN